MPRVLSKRTSKEVLTQVENPDQVYHRKAFQIKELIKQYWLEHGYGPTVREIQVRIKHSSTSVTDYWLSRMTARGDILMEPGQGRTVRLPDMQITFGGDNSKLAS